MVKVHGDLKYIRSYRAKVTAISESIVDMLREDFEKKYIGQQAELKFYFNQYLPKYHNRLKRMSLEELEPIYNQVKTQWDFDKGNCMEVRIKHVDLR